jgi:uncharacterized protein
MQAVDYRNSWIVAVDRAERPLPLWAALLYAVAVIAAATLAAQALFPLLAGDGGDAAVSRAGLVAELTFFSVLLAGGLVAGRLIEGRPNRGAAALAPGLGFGLGLLLGAAAFLLTVGLCAALGVLRPGAAATAAGAGLLLSAALTLFGVTAEEVFFRGWLQPLLCARLGPWIGVGSGAVFFSVAHVVGNPLGFVSVLNGTLAGVLFGLLALRTGSLLAPIGAHFAWNWIEKGVFGLFPNPGADGRGSLFDFELEGAGLWTGGSAALNGALPTTLALALACAVLLIPLWASRRR